MSLRDGTDFEGEAAAASALIDKLCTQYGIALSDLDKVDILSEVFTDGRSRAYDKILLLGVASYYDSKVFTRGPSLHVMGSEAQLIQTRVYFDFLKEVMESEARKAYEAEKLLSSLTGQACPRRDFLHAYKTSFAQKVKERLAEMKRGEGRVHEHAQLCHQN